MSAVTKPDEPVAAYQAPPLPISAAVFSLVCGMLALVTGPGGFVFGILAIVPGYITIHDARRGQARGMGMGIAGLVMGCLGFLAAIGLGFI